eukprot:633291_1
MTLETNDHDALNTVSGGHSDYFNQLSFDWMIPGIGCLFQSKQHPQQSVKKLHIISKWKTQRHLPRKGMHHLDHSRSVQVAFHSFINVHVRVTVGSMNGHPLQHGLNDKIDVYIHKKSHLTQHGVR